MYYLKGAASGGICCSITHAALCPVDVVKTRIQLYPEKYKSMFQGFSKVVGEEGVGALLTGVGATAVGYFVQVCILVNNLQGWFKFGGVEFFKINFANYLGEQRAWNNRTGIYLAASACAEFIADLFLCPLEAIRIRSVSDSSFPKGVSSGLKTYIASDGVLGLYAGLGPILFKQVPYTMAKFSVQGKAAEVIYKSKGKTPEQCTSGQNVRVSLLSGVIAGVAAAGKYNSLNKLQLLVIQQILFYQK